MRKCIDLTNKKFGRLTVIKRVENKGKETCWLCKCDCGNEKIIKAKNLKSGTTQSCGCLHKEKTQKINYKHGLRKTRLYNTWANMKKRCYNKNDKRYKNYGGRGIIMCDEWQNDFMSFYNWAINNGYKENLTIDRIDVNGNYEPNNCRWATIKIQANNTTTNHYITYNNETHTIAEWADILNINYAKLHARITKSKWNIERAFMQK